MSIVAERKHLLDSAEFWFNAAHKARGEGDHTQAFFNMVNAYNHIENAASAYQKVIAEYRQQELAMNPTPPPQTDGETP